jgi:ribosome modulation factor
MTAKYQYTPPEYQQGVTARDKQRNKRAPGYMNIRARHWWLAGWNDRDIELGAPVCW